MRKATDAVTLLVLILLALTVRVDLGGKGGDLALTPVSRAAVEERTRVEPPRIREVVPRLVAPLSVSPVTTTAHGPGRVAGPSFGPERECRCTVFSFTGTSAPAAAPEPPIPSAPRRDSAGGCLSS